jgi:hypothetical protein
MGFRHTIESPRLLYPEAELWGQSNAARSWDFALHDWSRWFDLHTEGPQAGYAGIRMLRPDILAWYQKQGPERPIYFTEPILSVRASKRFPREALQAAFPQAHGRYGCQLSYMVALAIHEGFGRIILYGNGEPYVREPNTLEARKWHAKHSSVLYWIALAEAKGIEIVYSGPCMFAPSPWDYGYDMGPGAMEYAADQIKEQ